MTAPHPHPQQGLDAQWSPEAGSPQAFVGLPCEAARVDIQLPRYPDGTLTLWCQNHQGFKGRKEGNRKKGRQEGKEGGRKLAHARTNTYTQTLILLASLNCVTHSAASAPRRPGCSAV